jgi:hypothetical protein
MVFDATFNNTSVISWWSVLLMQVTHYFKRNLWISKVFHFFSSRPNLFYPMKAVEFHI